MPVSAQRRLKHHFLVHASILYDFPLELISRYLRPPARQPAYRQDRPHEEFVANLGLSRVALVESIREAWASLNLEMTVKIAPGVLDDLILTKFADPGWIFRF